MAQAGLPHPFRRLVAYWIDKVCAWLLLGLIISVLGLDTTDSMVEEPSKDLSVGFSVGAYNTQFRPFVTLGTTTCGAPSAQFRAAAQIVAGEIMLGKLCLSRIFGVFFGGKVDVTTMEADGSHPTGTVPVNAKDLFTQVDLFAALVLLGFGGLGLATTMRTPWKWLMGLKVSGSPWAKLLREAIRLSPILVMLLLATTLGALQALVPSLAHMEWLIYGIALVVPLGLWAWFWLIPVMGDQTYFPWDRFTGCRLSHANE